MWFVAAAFAAAPPAFTVERGLYEAPFSLGVIAEAGDVVFVSTDGSVPTTPYTGPLSVTGTTVVRARARGADGSDSAITTATYVFVDDVIHQPGMDPAIVDDPDYFRMIDHTLRTLPTISLVVPGGMSFEEQAVSIEWIDPSGATSQVDCGSEIIGGTSYVYPKTSFRLHFRSEYGVGKWKVDLYGDPPAGVPPATSFDALTLRSGNHDSVFWLGATGQYTRNYWMDASKLEMGHIDAHGRYAHLYVNGVYNGFYHVRERFDAGFMAEYLGGDEEDYEAINGGSAFDGSGTAWNAVVAGSGRYASIVDRVNTPNFLDYMVLNFYAANAWDWLDWHNWSAAGPIAPGQGGFRFHNSDSDVVLVYDYKTYMLGYGGPTNVFANLLAEGDPDFRVALVDAIHRNLEDGGPLTAERAGARYARIAAAAEEGIVAESARWGAGWWDHDEEWVGTRDALLKGFFPFRTDELLDQMRDAGWTRLPAPEVDTPSGVLAPASLVWVSVPMGEHASLWVTTDGRDPREPGGAVAEGAWGPDFEQALDAGNGFVLKARLATGDTWGPLVERTFEVDAPEPIVLNEWNAVDPDRALADGDSALGTVPGNGGDWLELLVIEDHLDLRGWSLQMVDRREVPTALVFTDAPLLADLRAGTILTIAEDMAEDTSYEPAIGDWRFHLRAGAEGTGSYVSARPFDVTSKDWQLTIWDGEGALRVGAVGEGANPGDGIGGDEVGLLAGTPGAATRRWSAPYADSDQSTFGAPNRWGDGAQDLSVLRGESPGGPIADPDPEEAVRGCDSGASPVGGLGLVALVLGLVRRRRSLVVTLVALGGCAGASADPACFPDRDGDGFGDRRLRVVCGGSGIEDGTDCDDAVAATHPGAGEVCDGRDQDCDDVVDDDPVDGLPFFLDGDGDGFGSAPTTACARGEGVALVDGDCADADPAVHPGAAEHCDDVDEDCDGLATDAVGASSECPATSCLDIANAGGSGDGAYFVTLPSGTVTPVWCDLTTDGGGWTLGFLRNTSSTSSQGDFGAGEVELDGLATAPAAASASAAPIRSWLDLNQFPYTTLRLAAFKGGAATYLSRDIPKSELRIAFGDNGYLLYGGTSGYVWCGGDASYTDGGLGQVNPVPGGYAGCKGHGSLGSGWDFSEVDYGNYGLTLCGGDASYFLSATWAGDWTWYGAPGAAQAIWVR